MKFNWRANWEILLVLVIIVVGIVITTIAAIKNKGEFCNHLRTFMFMSMLMFGVVSCEDN